MANQLKSTSEKLNLAAIDIGSNAIRLAIGHHHHHGIHIDRKIRAAVRLGQDVFEKGTISGVTLDMVLDTFKQFSSIFKEDGVTHYRAVATSAMREAQNAEIVLKKVARETGIQIEVISGTEEAELICQGVLHKLELGSTKAALLDIGGGSVEVTLVQNQKIVATQSFPMGTVRILQKLRDRKLKEEHLNLIIAEWIAPLNRFLEQNWPDDLIEITVGTGGNLEALAELKKVYFKGSNFNYVSLAELVEITTSLKKMSTDQRIEKLKLRPDRADVIVPAALLVKALLRQCGVQRIQIPKVGLRDGLLWQMFERSKSL